MGRERFSFLEDNARELALILRRNLRFIVWFAIIATFAAGIITVCLPQDWRLTSTLQVKGGYDTNLMSMMTSAAGFQLPTMGSSSTEMQVLRSRFLREKAIAAEGMQIQTFNRTYGSPWGRAFRAVWNKIPGAPDIPAEYLLLADATVPPEWTHRVIVATVTESGGLRVRVPGGTEQEVAPGGSFSENGLSFKLVEAHAPAGRRFGLRMIPMREAERLISLHSGVYELGLSSGVLAAGLTWHDQFRGAGYMNTLVNAYIADNDDYKRILGDEKVSYLDAQIEQVKRGLTMSDKDLANYKRTNSTVELTEESKALIDAYAQHKLDYEQVSIGLRDAESMLSRLKSGKTEDFLLYSNNMQQDSVQVSMMQKLAEQSNERAALLQEMTEQHPSVKTIDAAIAATKKGILDNLRNRQKTMTDTRASLTRLLGEYETKMLAIPGKERDLTTLVRDRTVNENIYYFLVSKRQEVAVLVESQSTSIRLLDKAIPPEFPLWPSLKLNVLMGLLFGFLFGFAYCALKHYGSGRLRNLRHAYSLGAGRCLAFAGPDDAARQRAAERIAAAILHEVPAGGLCAIADLSSGAGRQLADAAAAKLNALGHQARVVNAESKPEASGRMILLAGDLVAEPLVAEAAKAAALRIIIAEAGVTPVKQLRANAAILSGGGAVSFVLVPSEMETEDTYTMHSIEGEAG